MTELSKEHASQLVIEFLKYQKGTDKIDVAFIERQDNYWIVSGTTPIQFGEMQWPERFSVVVDLKGRIRSTDFKLL
jgi:hypothetical protein